MNPIPWPKNFNAAALDKSGKGELYTYGDLGSTSTHLPYEGETLEAECKPVIVRTVRLDDLVDSGEIHPPQLIKIDVEGHGHRVLAGMAATLTRHPPIIFVVFHSAQEVDGVMNRLMPLGYVRSEIKSATDSSDPVIGRDFMFLPSH